MSTHIDEEEWGINALISDDIIDKDAREKAREFLSQFYEWDSECEEFDDTPKAGYHEYEIRVKDECDYGDEDYISVRMLSVHLPLDADAKRLAAIIGGTVWSGLCADRKEYCITYMKKAYVRANSPEEARRIFDKKDEYNKDLFSKFDGVVSISATDPE